MMTKRFLQTYFLLVTAVFLGAIAWFTARSEILSQEYTGRWYAISTSGGIAGTVTEVSDGRYIELSARAEMRSYAIDGELTAVSEFDVATGETIFGTESLILTPRTSDSDDAALPEPVSLVLTLSDNDSVLSVAENLIDGYSTEFRRSLSE